MPKKTNRDAEIFQECFAELSQESQDELTILIDKLLSNLLERSHRDKLMMGPPSVGGLLVAMIKAGYLPREEVNDGKKIYSSKSIRCTTAGD